MALTPPGSCPRRPTAIASAFPRTHPGERRARAETRKAYKCATRYTDTRIRPEYEFTHRHTNSNGPPRRRHGNPSRHYSNRNLTHHTHCTRLYSTAGHPVLSAAASTDIRISRSTCISRRLIIVAMQIAYQVAPQVSGLEAVLEWPFMCFPNSLGIRVRTAYTGISTAENASAYLDRVSAAT